MKEEHLKIRKEYETWLDDNNLMDTVSNFDTFMFEKHISNNRFSKFLGSATNSIIQVRS